MINNEKSSFIDILDEKDSSSFFNVSENFYPSQKTINITSDKSIGLKNNKIKFIKIIDNSYFMKNLQIQISYLNNINQINFEEFLNIHYNLLFNIKQLIPYFDIDILKKKSADKIEKKFEKYFEDIYNNNLTDWYMLYLKSKSVNKKQKIIINNIYNNTLINENKNLDFLLFLEKKFNNILENLKNIKKMNNEIKKYSINIALLSIKKGKDNENVQYIKYDKNNNNYKMIKNKIILLSQLKFYYVIHSKKLDENKFYKKFQNFF